MKKIFSVTLVTIFLCLTPILHAQFSLVQMLVGTGHTGHPQQGCAVSLSSDGNTAIVGGLADSGAHGAAWIFTRSGGVWSQQGSKLFGTGNTGTSFEGNAVALSADGNTAIVGGQSDNSNQGAAWIFTRSGGVWSQQGNKLVGTGNVGAAEQGFAVALSADGNTAISSGYLDNSNQGAVWIFTRSAGVWTQEGSKLVGTGNVGTAQQGYSVSLSSDGNTAVVGGITDSSYHGAVWVFTRSGGVWSQQGSKIVGTGGVGSSQQGFSVALSSDGNTLISSGETDSSGHGASWIITRSGGVWTQEGSKLVGTGNSGAAQVGYSVSISSDGNTAIAGGVGDSSFEGAVWVFTRSGGVWSQQGSKLIGTYGANSEQGSSVSLSGDGTTIIFGAPFYIVNVGAAWIFQTPSAPLAAELTEFKATVQVSGVQLYWKTATELNNYGFEIERRTVVPLLLAKSWQKIGFVEGKGTSYAPHNYGYSDQPQAGTYAYRLKQIDNGGTFKYSSESEVTFAAPLSYALNQNYPNPFNPSTIISYQLPVAGKVALRVYDIVGKEIATLVNDTKEPGNYEVKFDASKLASGIYFYKLQAGSFTTMKKLMLIK